MYIYKRNFICGKGHFVLTKPTSFTTFQVSTVDYVSYSKDKTKQKAKSNNKHNKQNRGPKRVSTTIPKTSH